MHRRQGNGSVKLGSAEAEALPPGRRTSPSPAVGEELSHGQDPRRDGGVVGDLLAQATQRTIGSSRRSPRVIYQGGSGHGRANQGACDAQHRTACRCEYCHYQLFKSLARCNVRTSLGGGHLASLGPSSRLRAVGQRRNREPMLGDELRRLVVNQREVTADESAT